jgi:hypothetical protein
MKKIFIVAMVSMLSLSAFAVSNGVNRSERLGTVNLAASKLAAGKFGANLAAGKFDANKAGARVEKVDKVYPLNGIKSDINKTDYFSN